jgi:hypothetical protein
MFIIFILSKKLLILSFNFIVRNKLTILLLCVLILPFISIVSYTILKNIEIDNYFLLKINSGSINTELVEMKFSHEQVANEINWTSDREFIFTDYIYKIVKVKYSGNDIIYYCWRDLKKTELSKNLNNYYNKLNGSSPVNKTTTETVSKFFQLVFSLPEKLCMTINTEFLKARFREYNFSFPELIDISIEHPPKIGIC